uniref:Class I helical cytokine receptor number 20 n=1 Tax=Tetraodon nigroviridis TaxID=99883 RepID=Q6UAN6_TETNG|nr:class I helical cytokine receptor number 20 [Tetraodon nigroviridis]
MLIVCLLLSASIASHTAADLRLRCVNDYLFTINCSLTVPPADAPEVHWLYASDNFDQEIWCRLTEVDGGYFCSFNLSSLESEDNPVEPLNDLQRFKMSLCGSKQATTCRLLLENYQPQYHIKPNAPCCLGLSHNFSQLHFTWRSTYEEFIRYGDLTRNMLYQLQYYTLDQGNNISARELTTESLTCSVIDENLVPGAEYRAQVRSSPNQGLDPQVFYRGQWSDWSPALHWKTEPAEPEVGSASFLSGLGVELFLLCVIALLLLVFFACVKIHAYIPTPAPYFHTLYNDYHGDFKSWVVTKDKTADGLKVEETLQADTFTKCVDVQELGPRPQTPQQIRQEALYSNIPQPGADGSLPGEPCSTSTAAPAVDGSGCCMCSKQALESGVPLYSNEYCTLSAFCQSHGCSGGAVNEQRAQYEN